MGAVKDGASGDGEVVFAVQALPPMGHLPGVPLGLVFRQAEASAPDALHTIGPADALEVLAVLPFSVNPLKNLKQTWLFFHDAVNMIRRHAISKGIIALFSRLINLPFFLFTPPLPHFLSPLLSPLLPPFSHI